MLKTFFVLGLWFTNCFSADQGKPLNSHKIEIDTNDKCTVCLGEIGEKRALIRLACKHTLHMACLEEWNIEGRNNCPTCSANLTNEHSAIFSIMTVRSTMAGKLIKSERRNQRLELKNQELEIVSMELEKKNQMLEGKNATLSTENIMLKSSLDKERKWSKLQLFRDVYVGTAIALVVLFYLGHYFTGYWN